MKIRISGHEISTTIACTQVQRHRVNTMKIMCEFHENSLVPRDPGIVCVQPCLESDVPSEQLAPVVEHLGAELVSALLERVRILIAKVAHGGVACEPCLHLARRTSDYPLSCLFKFIRKKCQMQEFVIQKSMHTKTHPLRLDSSEVKLVGRRRTCVKTCGEITCRRALSFGNIFPCGNCQGLSFLLRFTMR